MASQINMRDFHHHKIAQIENIQAYLEKVFSETGANIEVYSVLSRIVPKISDTDQFNQCMLEHILVSLITSGNPEKTENPGKVLDDLIDEAVKEIISQAE